MMYVSVIIPCYNIESTKGNTINNTIDSIKKQTIGFENIEVILVNDGSSDNTLQILLKYSNEYDNVRVFSNDKNSGGASIPRNIGLKNSNCDYVMFLDCDDSLNTKTIELMYTAIKNEKIDIVKINHNVILKDKKYMKNIGIEKPILIQPKSEELKFLSLSMWDGMYKKSFLTTNNITFKNYSVSEDLLFTFECLTKTNHKIYLISDYGGINYNATNINSISHNCYNLKNLHSHINVSDKTINLLVKNEFNSNYVKEITTNLKFASMLYLFYSNDYKEKYQMFDLIHNFLKKFSKIDFIKTVELNTTHFIFWKIMNFLISKNFKNLTLIITKLINTLIQFDRHG